MINYGVGNLKSIAKALEAAGASVVVTNDIEQVVEMDALFLPGVGAFGSAMKALRPHLKAIRKSVKEGLPLLGICLGLQLLFSESEEDAGVRGIELFPQGVKRLPDGVKAPHMGWNVVKLLKPSPLLKGLDKLFYAYFVHSFCVYPPPADITSATTEYGVEFLSVLSSGHVFGTQFHPEKSGKAGLRLLKNFVEYVGEVR